MTEDWQDDENRYGYVFHRAEGFYPVMYDSDAEAIAGAEKNPGTLKVCVGLNDRIIWEVLKH